MVNGFRSKRNELFDLIHLLWVSPMLSIVCRSCSTRKFLLVVGRAVFCPLLHFDYRKESVDALFLLISYGKSDWEEASSMDSTHSLPLIYSFIFFPVRSYLPYPLFI